MRQKHLESYLSSLQREFPNPNIRLEQYPTSPTLAAAVVSMARYEYNDIGPGRTVLDLGCGTGMLCLAAALLECDAVWGVDCDASALQVAVQNAETVEVSSRMQWIHARVRDLHHGGEQDDQFKRKGGRHPSSRGAGGGARGRGRGGGGRNRGGRGGRTPGTMSSTPQARAMIVSDNDGVPLRSRCVDTVLTNPPFGTKHDNAGMDLRFLRAAVRLATRAVYSFHKTSTRSFILAQVQSWEDRVESVRVVAEMKFDLPATYKFHQQTSVDVQVDLIRVVLKTRDDDEDNSNNNQQEENENAEEAEDCVYASDDDEEDEAYSSA